MTVREQQVAEALGTRERQVERALRIEQLVIDWHDRVMPGHHGYSVCVKEHTLGGDRVCVNDDGESVRRYDHVRDQWWEDASELARQHGFEKLYSAGRSGGYAVPHPQPDTDWYDHEEEAWLRETFAPLALDLLDLLADYVKRWNAGDFDDD